MIENSWPNQVWVSNDPMTRSSGVPESMTRLYFGMPKLSKPIDWITTGLLGAFAVSVILAVVFIVAVMGPLILIRGEFAGTNPGGEQGFTCLAILLWGILYWQVKKRLPKTVFALSQICAAMASNWYQIGKIVYGKTQADLYDRWILFWLGLSLWATALRSSLRIGRSERNLEVLLRLLGQSRAYWLVINWIRSHVSIQ